MTYLGKVPTKPLVKQASTNTTPTPRSHSKRKREGGKDSAATRIGATDQQ